MAAGTGNLCCRFKGSKPSVLFTAGTSERVMERIDSEGYLVSLSHIETRGFIQPQSSTKVVLRTFQKAFQLD